ncbi:tripartite tricarboxylate transporter TctB family protein [Halorubrum sp. DTA98]|uniref:tripartite tricarboxylate transporter TctB family protein n=1 Tax=Halorubrum sp. DTA98 TaxID=3402163 RepID=UPI003AACD30B
MSSNTSTTDTLATEAEPDERADAEPPEDPDENSGAASDGDDDDTSRLSTAYVTLVRFAFPVAGLVLAALYIENTYGELRRSNLYYPYFVISMLVVAVVSVSVTELRDLWGRSGDLTFAESVRHRARKWNRSIGLVFVGIVYIGTIDFLGFFPASFAGMIAIMLLGGLRDPKVMVGVSVLVLVAVYGLFIQLMGLQPPEGVLGI